MHLRQLASCPTAPYCPLALCPTPLCCLPASRPLSCSRPALHPRSRTPSSPPPPTARGARGSGGSRGSGSWGAGGCLVPAPSAPGPSPGPPPSYTPRPAPAPKPATLRIWVARDGVLAYKPRGTAQSLTPGGRLSPALPTLLAAPFTAPPGSWRLGEGGRPPDAAAASQRLSHPPPPPHVPPAWAAWGWHAGLRPNLQFPRCGSFLLLASLALSWITWTKQLAI